jgi:hypothetical protein
MKEKEVYSASLERLPDGFYEWEQDGRNPSRQGHWRDFLQGGNPDWLKRSKVFYDDSNPPKEGYAGEHTDYNLGGTWRFSEEGEFPGGDSGYVSRTLRDAVENDCEGRRRFRLTLEAEDEKE